MASVVLVKAPPGSTTTDGPRRNRREELTACQRRDACGHRRTLTSWRSQRRHDERDMPRVADPTSTAGNGSRGVLHG